MQDQNKPALSNSYFYMWRCIVAIAHADGLVHAAEKEYLEKVFKGLERKYATTPEQMTTLRSDMLAAQNISTLLSHINEPAARGELIYFAGLLARADGELHPSEDAIIKKLHADQMSALDMDQIRADAKKAVTDAMFQADLEKSALRPQSGITAVLDALLLRLGIDVLD